MSNEMLKYFMIGIGALFAVIVIAFLIIKKKSENRKEAVALLYKAWNRITNGTPP